MKGQFSLSPEHLPLSGLEKQDRHRLTFGVEFEFLIANLNKGEQDPSPEDGRKVYGIDTDDDLDAKIEAGTYTDDYYGKKALQKAKLDCTLRHIVNTLNGAGIVAELALDRLDENWKPEPPKGWLVKTDTRMEPPKDTPYSWQKIEVITPAYYFSSQAIDTVKSVCEILTNAYRLNCNESTGLHVHVGNGTQAYRFETLRNLYAVLWTFEPVIKKIHPAYRTETNTFCHCLRDGKMALDLSKLDEPVEIAGLNKILNMKTNQEIYDTTGLSGRGSAYNMNNVIQALKPGKQEVTKNTFEFRQHVSTLDPERFVPTVNSSRNF